MATRTKLKIKGRLKDTLLPRRPTAPDWTPVRKGLTYCSPACGSGCTHAAFLKATREGRKLAKALGEGWEPEVHENGTWYWTAVIDVKKDSGLFKNGTLAVNPDRSYVRKGVFRIIGYTADLRIGGRQFRVGGRTAMLAVRNAMRAAEWAYKSFSEDLSAMRFALAKKHGSRK